MVPSVQLRTRLLATLGGARAQLARGRELAAQGRHSPAFPWFRRAARGGLPEAWTELGHAYLGGLGVPSSLAEALSWLTRAASAGEVAAQTSLARLALQGVSTQPPKGLFARDMCPVAATPDYEAALAWGERAAANGSADAQALIGFILTSGPPDFRDVARGEDNYRQSAAAGCPHGQLGVALMLLGRGSANSAGDARELLQAAAESGLAAAHYLLGVLAESGAGSQQDFGAAAAHYRAGAELGHRSAQLRYGMALLSGRGVVKDVFDGESWLRRAGLAGEPLASAMVGDLYAARDELPPNDAEAATWFRRAAEAGHAGAARALGCLYLGGRGVPTDCEEAAHWFRRAAACGDDAAAFNLGLCFAQGIGVARDRDAALALFRRAADAGHSAALSALEAVGEIARTDA